MLAMVTVLTVVAVVAVVTAIQLGWWAADVLASSLLGNVWGS
ncbi:divalent metal cation (Fe/Co/Zn/Cd) transporter [Cupriavidus metallidurans]